MTRHYYKRKNLKWERPLTQSHWSKAVKGVSVGYRCAMKPCRREAGHWLGNNTETGEDGWVCGKHLQYASIQDGRWVLHRHLRDARRAQAREFA